MEDAARYQQAAQRALDLSELPPATARESAGRLTIQLKEVLDRIQLPPLESIPDAQAMAKAEFKRWAIPDTDIWIQRIETGPRAGEYLFTPETLSRLPEFYARVKDLPYKPGASVGWYDLSTYSPTGLAYVLARIVPTRWLVDTPNQRVRTVFLDQPVWRWIGIFFVLGAALAAVRWCFRLSRYLAGRSARGQRWAGLLRPLSLAIVTPVAAVILAEVLRVSGSAI